ncbi:hypothetical protein ACVWWG_006533 [Bradyrhizobium sp. LB7.2]
MVPPLGAADIDLRRFAHFESRERFAAIMQRDGSDFLARPFDRFMQIVERLAVERNGYTSSTTAAGRLRACVETMMSRNDPAMGIEQINRERRNGAIARPRYHAGGFDPVSLANLDAVLVADAAMHPHCQDQERTNATRIGRCGLVILARIKDLQIGVGRDPLLRLVGHDVGCVRRAEQRRRRRSWIDADFADGGLASAIVWIVRVIAAVAWHRDVVAGEDVSHLVGENEIVGKTCVAPREGGADAFSATAPRVVGAGSGGNSCARHKREDNIAELEQSGEDARDSQVSEQAGPRGVTTSTRRGGRKCCRAVRRCAKNRRLKIGKRQHPFGRAHRAEHNRVGGARNVAGAVRSS